MNTNVADRNLLFGMLALQNDFVSHDALMGALNAWVLDKQQSLGSIFAAQNLLEPEQVALLEGLVHVHIKRHDNDPEKSLAAIGSPRGFIERLQDFADEDVRASIRRVNKPSVMPLPSPSTVDPYATNVGASTIDPPPAGPQRTAVDPYSTNVTATTGPTAFAPPPRGGIGASTSSGLRFRVLRPFARGGLGEVLIAEDQELHREVALKQIQDRHADDEESRRRFVVEAEITGALEHPGIVPVYGLGQYSDGRPYYAMRFIRGDSLNDAIDRFHKQEGPTRDPGERALSLRQLLGRFVDVCQAIAYAHSRGILHRDLKPGNIMLGKYGETLVVDWGLAKPIGQAESPATPADQGAAESKLAPTATGSATVMGSAVGTPQFMSPEQAAGQLDKMGPASDVYSLGATLYALLTNAAPVTDRSLAAVLKKVQEGDFPKPRQVKPNIHPALEAVCLKAMALKPEDRYSSPRLLADDIEHWMADEPVSAWREPWWLRAGRWLRRHKTKATVAAAVIVVALVALIITNVLLTAANERERQAKNKAEDNFRLAKSAVDNYHTKVSEEMLLQEPGMEPLRKRLLEDASTFYAKFVEDRRDDPALKGELARAKYRLGLITADIETEKEGIRLLEEAATILETDKGVEVHTDLARCYHHLGRLFRKTDQIGRAEEMYRRALEEWQASATDADGYVTERSRSELGLGNVFQVTRKLDQAETEYTKALAGWNKVLGAGPARPEEQRYQGLVHSMLAVIFAQGGKADESRKEIQSAIELQTLLAKENPNLGRVQNDLASSYFFLGDTERQAGARKPALAAYDEAAKIWRQLTTQYPSIRDYHNRLLDTLAMQAYLFRSDGKAEQAVQIAQETLQVQIKLAAKDPEAPNNRGDVARRRFQLGNALREAEHVAEAEKTYLEAITAQKKLTKELPDVPHYQADLARSLEGFGQLRIAQKQYDQAERELIQALEIWKALQRQYPKSSEFPLGIATACINLRSLATSPGGYRVALAPLDQVIGIYAANKVAPTEAADRRALYQAYYARAEARSRREMHGEALDDWLQALNLAPKQDQPWLSIYRAVSKAYYGQIEDATGDVKDLTVRAGNAPEALYHIARVYAVAALVQSKKNDAAGKKKADEYAERSVQLLEQARALGWFASADTRAHLTQDPDWQFLRPREPFQALLRKINEM